MNQRIPDPRHIVTADAFVIAPSVLGLPLASGKRRLVAFLVDLVLVGFLSLLGWRILGVLLGFFFFRLASRGGTTGIGRAFRVSVGCLGAVILFSTFLVATGWVGRLLNPSSDAPDAQVRSSSIGLTEVLGGLAAWAFLRNVEDPVEWENSAVELGGALMAADLDADVPTALEALEVQLPETLEPQREAILARVETRLDSIARLQPAAAATSDSVPADSATVALQQRIASLESALERQREAAREAERQAEEAGGLFGWFVGTLDEAGLTFGWGALYFSTLLTWLSGRTVGKRLLGVRVVRLDGGPMTLYLAFERSGGYAAGVATGLLGFAQILWDPNRQGIHDKIAATVVVREGAQPSV